jgi:hypothetical protein
MVLAPGQRAHVIAKRFNMNSTFLRSRVGGRFGVSKLSNGEAANAGQNPHAFAIFFLFSIIPAD